MLDGAWEAIEGHIIRATLELVCCYFLMKNQQILRERQTGLLFN